MARRSRGGRHPPEACNGLLLSDATRARHAQTTPKIGHTAPAPQCPVVPKADIERRNGAPGSRPRVYVPRAGCSHRMSDKTVSCGSCQRPVEGRPTVSRASARPTNLKFELKFWISPPWGSGKRFCGSLDPSWTTSRPLGKALPRGPRRCRAHRILLRHRCWRRRRSGRGIRRCQFYPKPLHGKPRCMEVL